MTLPLPKRAAELIGQVKTGFHPGLALDKHLEPPADAEQQKPILQRVCSAASDQKLLDSLTDRRRQALSGALTWKGKNSGPLTLHLSRATALENAGIALHPIYGFAYLPGSGLKGLARAWAERIWLEAQPQPKRDMATRRIREVFGYAPNSERGKTWISEEIARDPHGSAGALVFHDAWPTRWPKLTVDIVGVHHPNYYQASEGDVPPPGDWEDPKPITFLAVASGAEFEFAVAPRRPQHSELAQQAAVWLKAALVDWGAGAKTAAGYGRIVSENLPEQIASPRRRSFECTLELVTPAFLAGASRTAEDCDLRGATLRGQLRWWWRTMHAGHLEPRLLRRLETAIWGAAGEGGAVQIALTAEAGRAPQGFTAAPTTPLGYLAYGMQAQGDRGARVSKPAGSKWALAITSRDAEFRSDPKSKPSDKLIPAEAVIGQARAALWLLTHYGGVGAKGRKGFGSLADAPFDRISNLDGCKELAENLRKSIGLAPGRGDFRAPCLEKMWLPPQPIPLRDSAPEQALGAVAKAYRTFVNPPRAERSQGLPFEGRRPLGLPRVSRRKGELSADFGRSVGQKKRHPTTLHFHISRSSNGLDLRTAGSEIEPIVSGTGFFHEMEAALRRSLGQNGSPDTAARRAPQRGGPRSQQTTAPTSPPLLFRRGDRVRNADGETGTVLSDVRIGDTEMMVDIGGDHEREQVKNWHKT
ncbi:MAG TPA: type III-B CRISPR module RAMP protein Cmr6 [Stellaceae bacterium]|jgi:CRISPR-associated protein Cmr6